MFCKGSGMELQIEIKPGRGDALYQGLEARLCAMIAARGLQEQVLVTSFFIDALHEVQRIAPDQRFSILVAVPARMRVGQKPENCCRSSRVQDRSAPRSLCQHLA